MLFEGKNIVYSLEDNWDELVNITFVNELNYVSFNALAYEDEIGIELNDQTNYVSVLKKDVEIKLIGNTLYVKLENPIIQHNFPCLKFSVSFCEQDNDKLKIALKSLLSWSL